MIWKADVHIRRLPKSELDYIGTTMLKGPATKDEHVWFAIDGKTKGGRIELIEPFDWQNSPGETIPKVVIALDRMLGP